MADALDPLIESLLFEGYSLYPYTPTATKNATPTPFGIVYPPAYASGSSSTFDHLELRCVLESPDGATLRAEVRFLAPSGPRHEALPQTVSLDPVSVAAVADAPVQREVMTGGLTLAVRLGAEPLERGVFEVTLRVENRTACAEGQDRAGALAHSLLSTHPLVRVSGGRFRSPLERPRPCVNTFPVLATPADDAVLGAAIVLPEHPQIAPESRGDLFDSTEIEEALLLHVQTLTDAEREQIGKADPAVAEMVARAAAATPDDILALHGRVTLRDPVTVAPPEPSPGLADPSAGQDEADVAGVIFRRGGHVRIRELPDADLHARLLAGRTATIERIFTDYDGKTHLGVTIDGDPGQELMRETNRLLFFFAPEVEVIES